MHYPSTSAQHISKAVLHILDNEVSMYGYTLTQQYKLMVQAPVKESALYPILHFLEQEGFLTTEITLIGNRRRKHYMLSTKGRMYQVVNTEQSKLQ